MLDLAARLSTGRSWPDGNSAVEPAGTIYLSAEDGDEDTIRPRLQALGADLGRIFVLSCKNASLARTLSLPSHINFLDRALTRTGARLVVIDPVVAFLDRGILSASDESIRRALAPLARLAQKHQCVIILIRHLNKKAGSRSMYRGGGSIGLVAQCRSGWLVGLEPQKHNGNLLAAADSPAGKRCVLAQIKNNNAPLQPSLLYEIVPHESGYPTIRWLGPCAHDAEDLVSKPAEIILGPRFRACQFLKNFLADGPRSTNDIWDAGFQEQLYERTLRRARKDANVTAKIVWIDGKRQCYWLLPGQHVPSSATSKSQKANTDDLDRFLDNYRRMYQSRTPLDHDEDSGPDPGPPPAVRAQERRSAERANLPEVECAPRHGQDFVKALAQDQAETPKASSPVGIFAPAQSPESGRQGCLDDLAKTPIPPACETPNPKRETSSIGPPATVPAHARWIWYLMEKPLENAG